MDQMHRLWEKLKNDRRYWAIAAAVVVVLAAITLARPGALLRPGVPRVVDRDPIPEPTLRVFFHDTGEIRHMPMEEYLMGVVAAEMDPNWPRQALAAQAIIARTFTMRKLEAGGVAHRNADASTDPEEFQAYDAGRINDNVRGAVQATRGEIITHQGRPILAWFHASSGGRTATAEEGLGFTGEPTPYIRSISDLEETDDIRWSREFTAAQIMQAAAKLGVPGGALESIREGKKGPSGRLTTLVINGREVPAPDFRLAIGSSLMRSTLIDDIRHDGNTVTMRGRGFGHGVGMSQWGAWVMAQRGRSAEEIVGFYYHNILIERFWR
ncbi:MAG: SpoIID/LytB domain-containing protein [Bacillota bacterium]